MSFEKLFESDKLTKRERVERTVNMQSVDRVALHEQLSYNPDVISYYLKKEIKGYNFTKEDIGQLVQKTLDLSFPVFEPYGLGHEVKPNGFEYRLDNWTKWLYKRPFTDEHGACDWLKTEIKLLEETLRDFDPANERKEYHAYIAEQQSYIGETVLMDWSIMTRFCEIFDKMGLEIFTFFYLEYPDVMERFMELSTEYSCRKVLAAGDNSLTPVVLIAEDFCSKTGPIFSPETLYHIHYPYLKRLTEAWHDVGLKVIYHTDGDFRAVIPDLLACDVDGFYCLERSCNMHIEKLAIQYPDVIWAGGVDGVRTMEFGTPADVREEVLRIIDETEALTRGGILIDSSSEINPTIPVAAFEAMVNAVDERRNPDF